jgi:hypothetical protein
VLLPLAPLTLLLSDNDEKLERECVDEISNNELVTHEHLYDAVAVAGLCTCI